MARSLSYREIHAEHPEDHDRDDDLNHADHSLIDHVRRNVCGHVEPRTVFTLNYGSLTAYHLNGIEKAVPDTDAHEGENAHLCALLGLEYVRSDDEGDQSGYERSKLYDPGFTTEFRDASE